MIVLGIIPARSGSKRVPDKNVRMLDGKPLIAYTLEAALQSKKLHDVIVSTDDVSIQKTVESLGGRAPFLRPEALAQDDTPDRPVLLHAVDWYTATNGITPDAVMLLRPTTPFKTAAMIDAAITLLEETGADSVRSMTRVQGVHHPYWMYGRDEKTYRAQPFLPEISTDQFFQSQLLPEVFRLNGVVDIMRTYILKNPALPLYGKDMRMLEIDENDALDIDTPLDFEICEILMKRRIKEKPKS